MNYELAKKLKDAGFLNMCKEFGYGPGCDNCEPTLSELIEACGEKFGSLVFHDKEFAAYPTYVDQGFQPQWFSTPEEAVANLWLYNKTK